MAKNKNQELVEAAIKQLKGKSETEDGSDFIVELELESGNNQIVYVWLDLESVLEPGNQQGYVFMEADVADFSDEIDFSALLKEASDFVLCRLYIDEEDDDNIAVQAALPLNGLTEGLLAAAIQEVAMEADRFEDLVADEG